MKPDFKSNDPNPLLWYELENDKYNYCELDSKTTGLTHDGRYNESGLVDSLANVQNANGISMQLQNLLGYFQTVNPMQKQYSAVKGWNRAAISWSLKCDDASTADAGNDRQAIYKMLKEGSAAGDNMTFTRMLTWMPILICLFSLCSCCAGGVALNMKAMKTNANKPVVIYLVGTTILLIIAVLLVTFTPKAVQEKHDQEQKLLKYEAVNGCSDRYVNLPVHMSDVVADSVRYMEKIPSLAWFVLIITVINLFMEFGGSYVINKFVGDSDEEYKK
jgi:hypothetical protein